jgi:hypothetical protein
MSIISGSPKAGCKEKSGGRLRGQLELVDQIRTLAGPVQNVQQVGPAFAGMAVASSATQRTREGVW